MINENQIRSGQRINGLFLHQSEDGTSPTAQRSLTASLLAPNVSAAEFSLTVSTSPAEQPASVSRSIRTESQA